MLQYSKVIPFENLPPFLRNFVGEGYDGRFQIWR